jgi:serine/threonine protein kinase
MATRFARAIYRGDAGVGERVLAVGHLVGYRLYTLVTPRLPEKCVPRQIIHRDVKGLNFLLKEMSGYFETCICDFGAPSTSSAHGRWRCLGRSCRGRRCARREPRGHRVQDGLQGNPRLHVARAARGGYPLGTAAGVASAVAEASDAQDVRVTIKSDVFAFAVFMWEMATRMHPWHGLGLIGVCAVPLWPGPDGGWVCAQLQTRRTRRVRTNTRARCLAQVVAKVVTQNARLSTELVEQVRRRIVGSLKPGFPLFHLLV